MKNPWLMATGLGVFIVLVSGCISQTQEEQTTGDDQQGAVPQEEQPFAQQLSGQQGRDMQRGPPQEAIDACSGKSDNDTCDFTMNGNAVTGFCRSRSNGVLTCFGSNTGQGRMFRNFTFTQQGRRFWGALLQEATDVCAGKSVNDTCEFKMNETVINGTCRARRNENITCIPSNMGQRSHPEGEGPEGQSQGRQPPTGQGIKDNESGSTGGN